MRWPPGTRVWVRCEDNDWWPAKVQATPLTMTDFVTGAEDCCVEFYHNPGQLYPILSSDATRLQPLHTSPAARSAPEQRWFANPRVRGAVMRLMYDNPDPTPITAPAPPSSSPPHSPSSSSSTSHLSSSTSSSTARVCAEAFSASELRNIQTLLGAVRGGTARELRARLQEAGMRVTNGTVRRQQAHELARRKRTREEVNRLHFHKGALCQLGHRTPTRAASSEVSEDAKAPAVARVTTQGPQVDMAPSSRVDPSVDARGVNAGSAAPPAEPERGTSPSRRRQTSAAAAFVEVRSAETMRFVPCADAATLAVLRAEVFENAHKFVLSPVYHFLDLLGAVAVANEGVQTTLPSPHAVRVAPAGGFERSRRVLLVALTEDYDHTAGWMQPVELEGGAITMRLAVNGADVPVPTNWNVGPAKADTAVKTAPVADITALVLPGTEELFTLTVSFRNAPPDTALWSGVVACVYVEERTLASIGEYIVNHYRTPRPSRVAVGGGDGRRGRGAAQRVAVDGEVVHLTEGAVKVRCPITTLPMEIPVRSVHCEHLQCMELAAVLIQCVHSNVWNCPLCFAAMTPADICVNYRLKDWLSVNQRQLGRVDYVVETPPGQPLRVQFHESRHQARAETIDLCDE